VTNFRTGGEILVDQLRAHGTDRVFGVPGESYLPVLDALHAHRDQLRFIACRQEGGAAMMAEADAKLTGRPGLCIVTRGPGATNASAGIHIARQDSTPVILLVGQASRSMLGREAFQEIDLPAMFAPVAKWATQIDSAERIPDVIAKAYAVALSDRPGPVVVSLPEDMLYDEVDVADAAPIDIELSRPSEAELTELAELFATAERPLMIVGGSGWDRVAVERLRLFAERAGVPVAASFRRQDYFDNDHPLYAGDLGLGMNPKLAKRVRDTDLLLVLGTRMGEVPSAGYTLLDVPSPRQTLVHVHADANELGRVYRARLPIHAHPRAMLEALKNCPVIDPARWRDWARAANDDYRAFNVPTTTPGPLQMTRVVASLIDTLPDDAIITNGAGNYTVFIHRFYRHRRFGTQIAPTAGSMGYGVPSAVAAKLRFPEKIVVSFSGDGCFLMNGQELATAVRYGANVVFIVVNNGMLGTIRMHQERKYPGHVIGTELINPDFAALATAYGAYGAVVERTEDFAAAFANARDSGKPSLLELRVDPEALTPMRSLSEIRAEGSGKA
jgi:acetolactate synthase-1/2/3 large subunit